MNERRQTSFLRLYAVRLGIPAMIALAIALALALVLAACIDAPKVVQGTVIEYDPSSKTLLIKDELPPGKELRLSLEGAEIGANPSKGDVVRLAYHEKSGALSATRVTNVSRQAEIGKKAEQPKTGKK